MAQDLKPLPPSYQQALELIDLAHSQDPNLVAPSKDPQGGPIELRYARQMTRWLGIRCPLASPELQLACRAQHFKRWELPRSSFPMTRVGYLTWRAKQKTQAATNVADLLAAPSISPPIAAQSRNRIAALIRKERLDTDEETQVLEDVACLVFLDDQFDDFEAQSDMDEAKMVSILRKTWGKMTESGRGLALSLQLSEKAQALIDRALEPATAS
ncbi:hypothetical protein HIM_04991 [Hirsutella minnesotensis 3608]|uniref:Glutamyl-tRNA synthetase n=1 Tax=Hirsutella minnesotensis 3608 TaxID=1043627 RepID=A0A0F7ZUV6_9HYPO|nr:hypothetical protein HIM_04991 [Hirsutella minnesotensis 3608]